MMRHFRFPFPLIHLNKLRDSLTNEMEIIKTTNSLYKIVLYRCRRSLSGKWEDVIAQSKAWKYGPLRERHNVFGQTD